MLSFLLVHLITVSFVTFSFWHQAEFGFEEHEHDEDVCEIYLYCEQTKDNNSDPAKSLEGFEHFTFAFVLQKNFLTYSKKYKVISTRAPPQFS